MAKLGPGLPFIPARMAFFNPYTEKLMKCIPRLKNRKMELPVIPGMVRSAINFKEIGCRFYERCSFAQKICDQQTPTSIIKDDRSVFCFNCPRLV